MSLGGGGAEPQVMVLHAARDAAAALRDLAAATAAACGKHVLHPDMERLKHAAKRLSNPKRWSLPINTHTLPKPKRRSINIKDYNSCDSETDIFQSDQEEELVKLLDYSSQDDDISPSIFYDSCEEMIAYIENLMTNPTERLVNDDVNTRYNLAAKNSLFDMDWRVLKYGENIFLGELKKLVDLCVECFIKVENKRKRNIKQLKTVTNELDTEMKRLSQVVEDLDWQDTVNENLTTKITTIQTTVSKRPKIDVSNLKSPVFTLKKIKPVNLIVNAKSPEIDSDEKSPVNAISPKSPESISTINRKHFWCMFKDDTEWWKALAKRNLERMEETKRELERFSGHELVLGEIQTEIDKFEKEKHILRSFIHEVDLSKTINKDLEYKKDYEKMVLKLIDFAKKDFIFKGFDPIIEKLKQLSEIEIERRKKVDINYIVNEFTKIDVSKFSYEELCYLENYYKEIIKTYECQHVNKENVAPSCETRTTTSKPSFHKNVILNVHSRQDVSKNVNQYCTKTVTKNNYLQRSNNHDENCKNNTEIYDITRTYPLEYYANNWWKIYEDVIRNRERQFGSIDGWWNFYESVLNKKDTSAKDMKRLMEAYESRRRSRPNSRLDEQMRMLDGVEHSRFRESEAVASSGNESVMVTNVTSLLKTVKAVEDEHTRGTRALESTIEAISQEIEVHQSHFTVNLLNVSVASVSPEELMRCTRLMTSATARAVAAGGAGAGAAAQEQLTAAANRGRKTVLDMLAAAKLERTEPQALNYTFIALSDCKHNIIGGSGSEWVDPADPTVIAEQELLGAAASIDAAARKLEKLRPRQATTQETDETLNFDEMILEAAKSIIAATSALVRAASAAQRELIDQGKVERRPASSSDDGQWSEGLVSAARLVAAAAHALVEAANALVQGAASEERLISSARQVASSTAQLLVACKVKADPSSESTRRLQGAGAEVIRSTDNLVRAARDAIHCDDERSLQVPTLHTANCLYRFKTPNSSFVNTTYSPNSTYSTQNTSHNQTQNTSYNQSQNVSNISHISHNQSGFSGQSPAYQPMSAGFKTNGFQRDAKEQSPSFSSFRPQEETPKQNYEGFTTRYETRLYDTPRPTNEYYSKTDEQRRSETNQYFKEEYYDAPKVSTPLSPKFNARDMKFDEKSEPIYSSAKSSKMPFDGVGQTFSEHQKSSEAIPGGTKHSEYSIKSESYQSSPKSEFLKSETRQEHVRSPFVTSTPSKFDNKPDFAELKSMDIAKVSTPDYDRISSPYGRDVFSYGGPNFHEETTTEVKEIPNGTQKITMTKIYSSSPVNLKSTVTKYEPVKLEGIDELSKFESDSKYSTLDSRFNTLESKMSSDTSRSFMRPSDFQSEFQTRTKTPSELVKEIDSLDKKFSKQTITSETIERKSVMTSSHKSETSSTVTKKFGNF
ncbi:unnamed protein product [Leptidea sinapis]|uniref:I/LWEQ domain-containing protein n=1 Tax=Leptidea sinapis TaxID=189913 RepID=A0A5E4QUX6_9NEOP|nr:unnamed protein product [Leptidea sinapis]